MATRTRGTKVSRRAAVAMLGSSLVVPDVLAQSDCRPSGEVVVDDKAKDPITGDPLVVARAPCPRLLPLVRAGGGRTQITETTNCEFKEMLDTLEKKENEAVLKENSVVVFGLKPGRADKLQQQLNDILKQLK